MTAFQRTALEDTELSGVQIKKGQRVVMFYRSANFDEEVFEDPAHLQHPAKPQPARRVRRHGRALLHRRQPGQDDDQPDLQRGRRPHADLKPIGQPERLRSGWLNGIKHWQVDYTGESVR